MEYRLASEKNRLTIERKQRRRRRIYLYEELMRFDILDGILLSTFECYHEIPSTDEIN